jgi:HJR/Mrr/RecB family endonuclease
MLWHSTLSNSSKKSTWVRYELNSALLSSAINKGIKIIPIKIDDSEVPPDLSNYLYADFSQNREEGLKVLKRALIKENKVAYEFQDWSEFDWKKFEDLIFDLLISEGLKVQKTPPTRDGGYDFIAKTTNVLGSEEKLIIESKFYKNKKISMDVIRQLYAISTIEKVNKVLLITNSELTKASRDFLNSTTPNITVWEGHELIRKLFSYPDLVKKYFPQNKSSKDEPIKLIDEELENVQVLIRRLDDCPEGIDGWKNYEDICIDVLNYLFGLLAVSSG